MKLDLIIPSKYIYHLQNNDYEAKLWFMDCNGKAHAKLYWFHDDPEKIFLSELSVLPDSRRIGIGTELQIIREQIGISLGFKKSFLWVVKGTWMEEWYKRRGYVFHKEHKKEENAIWLEKELSLNIQQIRAYKKK